MRYNITMSHIYCQLFGLLSCLALTFTTFRAILWGMDDNLKNTLGNIIRQRRITLSLTLGELANRSGISASHLGRIEKRQRFPSARILRRIAKALAFEEVELFTLAGYISPQSPTKVEQSLDYIREGLDPYVAGVLTQESVEVQRAIIGIITILRASSEARGTRGANDKLGDLCRTVLNGSRLEEKE